MLLRSPGSLWREVQGAAGGLPSSVPTPCHCSTTSPSLRLAKTVWSEAGTGGFPSAGLQGLRTVTVVASEIQMANTCALFPEEISCIYRIIKIHDLEVSWSKIWLVIVFKLLQSEPQAIIVGPRVWY